MKDKIKVFNKNTKLYIVEQINNPNFNSIEFEGFRKQLGLNSFILTSKLLKEDKEFMK